MCAISRTHIKTSQGGAQACNPRSLGRDSQPGLIGEFQCPMRDFCLKNKQKKVDGLYLTNGIKDVFLASTHIYSYIHMNKHTQVHTKGKGKKRQNPHTIWKEKICPFHTQMLVFLFVASNASKHILQCISDTLNTLMGYGDIWRCVYMTKLS